MERYDVAIVGAGPEGLIAATSLARAGKRVIVLERQSRAGGRAETFEFHPGFKAAAYSDELPAFPARLFRALGLAKAGAFLLPTQASACVSDSGISIAYASEAANWRALKPELRDGYLALQREVARRVDAIDARMTAPISPIPRRFSFWRRPRPKTWPGEEWSTQALDAFAAQRIADPTLRLHVMADATSGRAVSPFLAGTALNLLAPGTGRSGVPPGGIGTLGAALWGIAASAGCVMRCGTEVKLIRVQGGRAAAAVLASGEEVPARAVLSALDIRRTFLELVERAELKEAGFARIVQYRMEGQLARVLIALDAPPELQGPLAAPDVAAGPIHVIASAEAMSAGRDTWQAGRLPEQPFVTLRVPSFADPRLAPAGKAVMTATISAVPYRLAEGAWTPTKREALIEMALAAAERVAPGVKARVLTTRVIVPADIEKVLGLPHGDLDGGEFAPDQALSFRPFCDGGNAWLEAWQDARTPVRGLYLGGASSPASPVLLGVSGARAARTILTDFQTERLR